MSRLVRTSLAGCLRPEVFNVLAAVVSIAASRTHQKDIDSCGNLQVYAPSKSETVDRSQFSRNLRLANARAQSQLRARRSSR